MPGATKKARGNRLTARQEEFCRYVALTDDPVYVAYKNAFDTENYSKPTLYSKSSTLLAQDKIQGRISEIRREYFRLNALDAEWCLNRLAELAKQNENLNAAVRATLEIGRVVAPETFTPRSESTVTVNHSYANILEQVASRMRTVEGECVDTPPHARDSQKLSSQVEDATQKADSWSTP